MKALLGTLCLLISAGSAAVLVYDVGRWNGERDAAVRMMQAADADRLQMQRQLDRCRGVR